MVTWYAELRSRNTHINAFIYWHCFKAYVGPTNGKIVLHKRQTAHADAVAGLPLPGLRRMAEPVGSTRLQIFTARRVCIARTMPRWQDVRLSSVRLSVRLLHADIVSKRLYISSFFSPSGSPTILFFPHQTGWCVLFAPSGECYIAYGQKIA